MKNVNKKRWERILFALHVPSILYDFFHGFGVSLMQLEVVHPRENEVDIREGNGMKSWRVIQLCNFSDLPSKFISREIGQGRARLPVRQESRECRSSCFDSKQHAYENFNFFLLCEAFDYQMALE